MHMHRRAWRRFTPEQRKRQACLRTWTSQPPLFDETYTVQSLIANPGRIETVEIWQLLERERPDASASELEMHGVVSKFAQMLACTHRARIWHQDMPATTCSSSTTCGFDKQKELHFVEVDRLGVR